MENLKKDPDFGLDSFRSWIVNGFCCWVLLTSTFCLRSSGVLFVGIVQFFGVTREEASVPFTAQSTCLLMGALLGGYLCEVFSCHSVLVSASLVTSAGISLCYIAPNIPFITFFLGIVHGASVGAIFVPVNILSTQYFKKWQATACSLVNASQGLSVFFMPQLATYFISQYGPLGTLLLIGGATLNSLPAALALSSPPWITAKSRAKPPPPIHPDVEREIPRGEDTKFHYLRAHLKDEKGDSVCSDGVAGDGANFHTNDHTKNLTTEGSRADILKKTLKVILSLKFQVVALCFAVEMYVHSTFNIVCVDLALDRNIEVGHGSYLLHAYAIGEIFFRVVGGFVVDRGYACLETVVVLSFVGNAVACEGLVWSNSLLSLLLLSFFFGASVGLVASMPTIMLLNYFKGKSLPTMYGTLRFIGGLLMLTRPPLIGYFRDNGGRYDGLFHTMAIVCGVNVVIWGIRRMRRKI